ncbi:MAG: flagellar basal body-associated FliL family protein [Fimbriimonadaceae bacterium]
MAEEAKEAPKKSGGKLPIIAVLVLLLGGGGFFMMKSQNKPAEKPELRLAHGEKGTVQLEEMLVNLKDPDNYARLRIALHLKEGYEAKNVADRMSEVRDAIITLFSGLSRSEVSSPEGKKKARRMIALAVNRLLEPEGYDDLERDTKMEPLPEPEEGDQEDGGVQKKSTKEKLEASEAHGAAQDRSSWDSHRGPILKVSFSDFATQ